MMTHYKKFKILQELELHYCGEMIFSPENAAKEYGAAFIDDKFKLGRDYEVHPGCILDKDGVKPHVPYVVFTYKGVKRLLKVSQKARDKIDELWREYIVDADTLIS